MEHELMQDSADAAIDDLSTELIISRRPVSGTYRSPEPAGSGRILELRVDVDGTRPQKRLSGDVFQKIKIFGFTFTMYVESFVVENPVVQGTLLQTTITGAVKVYGKPERTGETITVVIPRLPIFSPPAPAAVSWKAGGLVTMFACPKVSRYLRTATVEIDRFVGTSFPPTLDPDISPAPEGLPATVGVREVFTRSGIDLAVVHDDVLSDPDGPDAGSNWSEVELHDLMEARFDTFANQLQWRMYGVIVPRFGDPAYEPGYYGTMFDWGGWQPGDTHLRQGCAIAEDAIRGRSAGTLYDTAAKKDRLLLQTLIHEIGHTWNLPHTWARTAAPSTASTSFMNYPWGYTGGAGGEAAFWGDFRWTFDDVELVWMRHADRADVMFGGRDWIGDNLSRFLDPVTDAAAAVPVRVVLTGPAQVDAAEPVVVTVAVVNDGPAPVAVPRDLAPEGGHVHVFLQRPDGAYAEHRPPTRRLLAPEDVVVLGPGESHTAAVQLSFPSTGPAFVDPGQYRVRAMFCPDPEGMLASNALRIRVAAPTGREAEELTELVTRPEVARFLYFGGSARRPELAGVLTEAAERYEKASPATAAHLRAALGTHAARDVKYVAVRDGVRTIAKRPADPEGARTHLGIAAKLGAGRLVLPRQPLLIPQQA